MSEIGRRGFVKLGIGATAATAGIGAGSSPAAAESCDPEQSLSCSYGYAPDYGVSYLVGRVKEHFSGLGDTETYSDKQRDQLYIQTHQDISIIRSENDRTLTQASNLIANAKSVAYQIGRAELLEQLNSGADFADAKVAAEDEITAYFVPTQKNVIERYSVMITQIELSLQRANELGIGRILEFDWFSGTNSPEPVYTGTTSYTLLNGETMDYQYPYGDAYHLGTTVQYYIDSLGVPDDKDMDSQNTAFYIIADSNLGYESKDLFKDWTRWRDLMNNIESTHQSALDEFRTFANGIQTEYIAGDISTEDLVTPRDLWEMSSDDVETPYAAADLAGLGLEVNQESSVVINLLNDGISREGTVYLSKSPIGNSLAVGNVYDPNLSRSTDSNGNYTDIIDDYAGTESDPIPLDGLAFIAYNTDNGSTYDQIQQPFNVESAFGEDGQELQNVDYAPSTGQQTTTTDIDELRSELQSLNDEIIELEEERRKLATSSTGTGVFGGNDGGIIAAAAAGGALLFVLLGGGSS